MALEKLNVKRYDGKGSDGYYSFATKVCSKEFVYLETSRGSRDIEEWGNNFSEAYFLERDDGVQKLMLFSTFGVSTFDVNWEGRNDFPLDRNGEKYRALERLAGDGDLGKMEDALLEFVLD